MNPHHSSDLCAADVIYIRSVQNYKSHHVSIEQLSGISFFRSAQKVIAQQLAKQYEDALILNHVRNKSVNKA